MRMKQWKGQGKRRSRDCGGEKPQDGAGGRSRTVHGAEPRPRRSTAASWRRCPSSRGCRISARPSLSTNRAAPPPPGRTPSPWAASRWVRPPRGALARGWDPRRAQRGLSGAFPHLPRARGGRSVPPAPLLPAPAAQRPAGVPGAGLHRASPRPVPLRCHRAGKDSAGPPGRRAGAPGRGASPVSPPCPRAILTCGCRWARRRWDTGTSTCPTPWSPFSAGRAGWPSAVSPPGWVAPGTVTPRVGGFCHCHPRVGGL